MFSLLLFNFRCFMSFPFFVPLDHTSFFHCVVRVLTIGIFPDEHSNPEPTTDS